MFLISIKQEVCRLVTKADISCRKHWKISIEILVLEDKKYA
jgi:hypothetical protein